jgi:hypothetical protein
MTMTESETPTPMEIIVDEDESGLDTEMLAAVGEIAANIKYITDFLEDDTPHSAPNRLSLSASF